MKPAQILLLLTAAQALTACDGFATAGVRLPPPDPAITEPCLRPEVFLGAGDWELIAGRIGDALIVCGENHKALVGRDTTLRAAMTKRDPTTTHP